MTAAAPGLGGRSFRQPGFEDYLAGRIREQEPDPEVERDGGPGKHCQEQEDDSGEGWTDAQLGGETTADTSHPAVRATAEVGAPDDAEEFFHADSVLRPFLIVTRTRKCSQARPQRSKKARQSRITLTPSQGRVF